MEEGSQEQLEVQLGPNELTTSNCQRSIQHPK